MMDLYFVRPCRQARNARLFHVSVAVAVVGTLMGCGSGGANGDGTAVSGTVLFNGAPLTAGKVLAVHDSGATVTGSIDPSGSFVLAPSEGKKFLPGDYAVTIAAYEDAGEYAGNPEAMPKSLIPRRYMNQKDSGLSFSVSGGESKTVEFKLQE